MDDIETICAHSFRNFHTRGFDYLCLSRTPELTRKVYFFDGDLAQLPELVMPHDHRYSFVTTVLAGAVRNKTFYRFDPSRSMSSREQATWADGEPGGVRFDRFEYLTPLNGGDGFTWAGEEVLMQPWGDNPPFHRGMHYRSNARDIHTLDVRCEGTVILLEQLADVVPIGTPTNAWRRVGDRTPPDLSGLYDRMTPEHARMRIGQFLDLIGNR